MLAKAWFPVGSDRIGSVQFSSVCQHEMRTVIVVRIQPEGRFPDHPSELGSSDAVKELSSERWAKNGQKSMSRLESKRRRLRDFHFESNG